MRDNLSEAISGFDAALDALADALDGDPALVETVFAETDGWTTLLRNKLVPQTAGPPYLAVVVAGGTNSGKSTVFNTLLGADISPVRATAAATCHPVLAGNAERARQALDGVLTPEFRTRRLEDGEDVLTHDVPDDTLFVVERDALPTSLVLMDTPDVDSIDKANWSTAESIRAAGDVLVAVVTGEKYKDEKVVSFFRAAAASGRIVLPLMNKADPYRDFDTARAQLDDFCKDVGLDGPRFLLAADPTLKERFDAAIIDTAGGPDLKTYLAQLDAAAIKNAVFEATAAHFAAEAETFLERLDALAEQLDGVVGEFDGRALEFASRYKPVPGADIGGLLHAYIQERRGPVRRFMGATGGAVAKGVTVVGKRIRKAIVQRASLEHKRTIETEEDVDRVHLHEIESIARKLATSYVDSSQNVGEPAAHLLAKGLEGLDIESQVQGVADDLMAADLSDAFKAHAQRMLDEWWNDPKSSRRFIEAADGILAIAPAAVAVFVGVHTAGVGTAEITAVSWPLAQQLMSRAFEHGFGDRIFDFLRPWQEEQRALLAATLQARLTEPCLQHVESYRGVLSGGAANELKRWRLECLNALAKS